MVTANSFVQMTLIFTWMIHIPSHLSLVSKWQWSCGLSSIQQKKKYWNQIPNFKTTDSFLYKLCTYESIKKEIFLVQFDRDLFSAVGFFFLRWWLLGFLEERTMHLFWTFGIFITFVKALFCHSIGIRGKSQMQIKKKSTKRSSSAFPTASFQEARQVNLIALTLLQWTLNFC